MAAQAQMKVERFFYVTASLALVVGLLYWAQPVFVPLAVAILFTIILAPLVGLLQHGGVPRVPAVLIVVIIVFGLLAGVGNFVYGQMKGLAQELPGYKKQIEEKLTALREETNESWIHKVLDFANVTTQTITDQTLKNGEKGQPVAVQAESSSLPLVRSIAGRLMEFLVNAFLVMILVIFMLAQREDLRNRLVQLLGHHHLSSATRAIDDASRRISRFLLLQFLLNVAYGLVLATGLYFIGIPYAFFWGILTAMLRYVPYIGAWIGAFFPLTISLGVLPGWTSFFLVAGYILVLELIHANVVEPLVFGHSVGISGVAFLVAALFWTWLWGPIGLVLSTPLTACLYVFGRHVPALHSITILLGDEPPLQKFAIYYQRLLARDPDEAEEVVEEFVKDHAVDQVYDEILLPALVLAKHDREEEELSERAESFILENTRDVLHDIVVPAQQNGRNGRHDQNGQAVPVEAKPGDSVKPLILGIAAQDEYDALVLEMIEERLPLDHISYVSARAMSLQEDVHRQMGRQQPAAVLLVALAGKTMARMRVLCKKIRTLYPKAKIIVGCWGLKQDMQSIRDRLQDVGADAVGTTFAETFSLLQPNLSAAS